MQSLNAILREKYLDFVNNYLTVQCFAKHNEITEEEATTILEIGRQLHEEYVDMFRMTRFPE